MFLQKVLTHGSCFYPSYLRTLVHHDFKKPGAEQGFRGAEEHFLKKAATPGEEKSPVRIPGAEGSH